MSAQPDLFAPRVRFVCTDTGCNGGIWHDPESEGYRCFCQRHMAISYSMQQSRRQHGLHVLLEVTFQNRPLPL